jgi:hypothetical protein
LAKNIVTAPLPHFRFTPMADIDHRRIDVRFVPTTEVPASFVHLVGQRKRHRRRGDVRL